MASLFDLLAPSNDTPTGVVLRDRALTRLRARRPALTRAIQRAFLRLLLEHGPATSDLVRDLVPIPPGVDPRVVGAAVRGLSSDYDLIRSVDRRRSRRAPAHGRKLEVWDVNDWAAARQWLNTHPDLSERDADGGDANG